MKVLNEMQQKHIAGGLDTHDLASGALLCLATIGASTVAKELIKPIDLQFSGVLSALIGFKIVNDVVKIFKTKQTFLW